MLRTKESAGGPRDYPEIPLRYTRVLWLEKILQAGILFTIRYWFGSGPPNLSQRRTYTSRQGSGQELSVRKGIYFYDPSSAYVTFFVARPRSPFLPADSSRHNRPGLGADR